MALVKRNTIKQRVKERIYSLRDFDRVAYRLEHTKVVYKKVICQISHLPMVNNRAMPKAFLFALCCSEKRTIGANSE